MQLCACYHQAFDLTEPLLIKSKMQHVIESKGISKNNGNSGGVLLEDSRICANDKIFLRLNGRTWNLHNSPRQTVRVLWKNYYGMLSSVYIFHVL